MFEEYSMEFIDYIKTVNGVDVWHRGGGWCIEVDAGVGGEGNDPPKVIRQEPVDEVSPTVGVITIDSDVEQRHRKWVQSEGWKVATHAVIAATAASQQEVQ
jgi:hypothetical protein